MLENFRFMKNEYAISVYSQMHFGLFFDSSKIWVVCEGWSEGAAGVYSF